MYKRFKKSLKSHSPGHLGILFPIQNVVDCMLNVINIVYTIKRHYGRNFPEER